MYQGTIRGKMQGCFLGGDSYLSYAYMMFFISFVKQEMFM